MPTPAEILGGLSTIARGSVPLAIAWHATFVAGLLAVLLGWRPGRATLGSALVLPLISAAALAFAYDNPFNGTVLALGASALLAIGLRLPAEPARLAGPFERGAGSVMLMFGLLYPHFVSSPLATLYAAPLGLLPCPTLAAVTGVVLLTSGLGSRPYSLVLSALGLFYGAFGVLRLGVWVDAVLFVGALLLFVRGLQPTRHGKRHAESR